MRLWGQEKHWLQAQVWTVGDYCNYSYIVLVRLHYDRQLLHSTPLLYTTYTSTTTSAITSFPATSSNVTTNIMDCITTDFRSHLYAQAFSVEVLRRSWILRWKLCVQNGSV